MSREIKSSLRQVIEKEKGKTYHTGEIRVIDLAEDCLREIERLEKMARATENKPIKVTKSPYNIAFCPKCKGSVWQNKDESKFCFRCGQMISW